jgi:hypothetical protein
MTCAAPVRKGATHTASGHPGPAHGMETIVAIGPVQLLVLGFHQPDFHGEIISELERLRASDTVRVIDSLAVYKDADGGIEVEHLSNLTEREAIEVGTTVGALIGLGIEGEDGIEPGAEAGAEAAAEGVEVFSDEDAWDETRRSCCEGQGHPLLGRRAVHAVAAPPRRTLRHRSSGRYGRLPGRGSVYGHGPISPVRRTSDLILAGWTARPGRRGCSAP